jgi:hypothetical protein
MSVGATNWAIYCTSSTTSGGVTFRDTALATTATVGYVFHPTMNGTPTGVPSPLPTGQYPFIFDSSGTFKGWAYFGAFGWKSVTFA